jgi:hypothetical protein
MLPARITSRALLLALIGVLVTGSFCVGQVTARESQPRMRSALNALRTARSELNAAQNDKGGHRVRALNLVDRAIDQVQQGIRYDNRY